MDKIRTSAGALGSAGELVRVFSKAFSKNMDSRQSKTSTITIEISKFLTKMSIENCSKGKMNKRFDKWLEN